MIVGDAAMHPAELMEPYGNIDPRKTSESTGIAWLHRIADHFDRCVWMNPELPQIWDEYHTAKVIRRIFPMFHLSTDGIAEAVQTLIGAKAVN
jgi:hypothetical protein